MGHYNHKKKIFSRVKESTEQSEFLSFKEFWDSEFLENLTGKRVVTIDGEKCEYTIRDNIFYDRQIMIKNGKVFFKQFWSNGKQSRSFNYKAEKVFNTFKVCIIRSSRISGGHNSVNYYLRFVNGEDTPIFTWGIGYKDMLNLGSKDGVLNTYEFKPIQEGPWKISDDDDYID